MEYRSEAEEGAKDSQESKNNALVIVNGGVNAGGSRFLIFRE